MFYWSFTSLVRFWPPSIFNPGYACFHAPFCSTVGRHRRRRADAMGVTPFHSGVVMTQKTWGSAYFCWLAPARASGPKNFATKLPLAK